MSDIAVIYKSIYGSTETYAKWLAEDLSADLLKVNEVKPEDLQRYNTIIYGGGLYAGGVSGIGLLTKNYESIRNKNLYLFTVGVADVNDPQNTASIRSNLEKTLPSAMFAAFHIYHLRGALLYSRLNFIHRTMMNMLVRMVSKKPESELRNEDKLMVSTKGQDVDYTDHESIIQLIADIRAITPSIP